MFKIVCLMFVLFNFHLFVKEIKQNESFYLIIHVTVWLCITVGNIATVGLVHLGLDISPYQGR